MNYLSLVLVLVLTSCGSEQSADNQATTSPQTQGSKPENGGTQTDNKATTTTTVASLYLNDRSLMPKCTADNLNQLIYILSEKKFYVCSAFQWAEVSIKGDKGDTGATGAQGSQGQQGTAGQNGTNTNGQMWFDPVTLKYWIIGTVAISAGVSGPTNEATYCGSNYHVPTTQELYQAMARGLNTAANNAGGIKEAWTKSPPSTLFSPYVVITGGSTSATVAGYYCMQN